MAMKTLSCDLCEHRVAGESFDDWMKALMPHWMEAHRDAMPAADLPDEEKRRLQAEWMARNRARFDAA